MLARKMLLAGLLALATTAPSFGADVGYCLNRVEVRAAVSSGKAVKLTVAVRSAKARLGGEVLRVKLCQGANGLVYLLTVLRRDGKVMHVTVDAATGQLVAGR
jgi:uncharacterized membrane protein YkoI